MLTNLRLQRNILLASSTVMILANSLLALKLYTSEIITRNLPITEQELVISKNYINDAALKIRADQIISLLFSMKKENVAVVTDHLLRQVDNEFYQDSKQSYEDIVDTILRTKFKILFGLPAFYGVRRNSS